MRKTKKEEEPVISQAWTLAWRLRYDKAPVTDIEIGETAGALFDLLEIIVNQGKEQDDG